MMPGENQSGAGGIVSEATSGTCQNCTVLNQVRSNENAIKFFECLLSVFIVLLCAVKTKKKLASEYCYDVGNIIGCS